MSQIGKPPKDGIGNTIQEGDFLHLKMQDPWIVVRVVQLEAGGLLAPIATIGDRNGGLEMPGKMLVLAEIPIIFKPGEAIPVLMKLQMPPGAKSLKKIVSEVEAKAETDTATGTPKEKPKSN